MKKNLKTLLTVLGCTLLLTACDNNQSGSSNSGDDNHQGTSIFDIPTDDDITPIEDVQVKEKDKVDPIEEKTCEEVSLGSCAGSLIDFMAGACMEPSYTYTCTFTHTTTNSGEYTVRSDDRGIAQVNHEAGKSTFTIKGITAGDAIIEAVSDENEVVLRFVVHVRHRYSLEDIIEKMYETNVYIGMFYGYRLSFTELNPIKGTLVGNDDFESTNLVFTLDEGVEEKIGNGTDFNTYKFKISADNENSSTSRSYTYLYISTTGDLIYMYYSNGIIDIFADHAVNIRK